MSQLLVLVSDVVTALLGSEEMELNVNKSQNYKLSKTFNIRPKCAFYLFIHVATCFCVCLFVYLSVIAKELLFRNFLNIIVVYVSAFDRYDIGIYLIKVNTTA